MELADRHVLVTGASRGIGAAIVDELVCAGARVTLVARDSAQLQEAADRSGGRAHVADLADAADVGRLVRSVESVAGPVDVLVNNAGVESAGALAEQDGETVDALYRVNLLAPVELCRQVLPGMLARGRGHLVNMSSLSGVATFPGLAAYGSSKAGLTSFTAGLRADLRGTPIGTTLVEVGPVPTALLDGIMSYAPASDSFARMYRLRLLRDCSAAEVARATVAAVQAGRRHVRLPRRTAAVAMVAEAPRRATELVLGRVAARAGR